MTVCAHRSGSKNHPNDIRMQSIEPVHDIKLYYFLIVKDGADKSGLKNHPSDTRMQSRVLGIPHSPLYALLHRTGLLWLQLDLLCHSSSHPDKQ